MHRNDLRIGAALALVLGLAAPGAWASSADDQKTWEQLVNAANTARSQPTTPGGGSNCQGVSLLGVCSDMPRGPSALSQRVPSGPVKSAISAEQSAKSAVVQAEARAKRADETLAEASRALGEIEASRAAIQRDQGLSAEAKAARLARVEADLDKARRAFQEASAAASREGAGLGDAQAKYAEAANALKTANSQPGAWSNVAP